MMGHEHTARARMVVKQAELKMVEAQFNAAKAGIEAVSEECDVAENLAAMLQDKLAGLLEAQAEDQDVNALETVE